MAGLCCFRVSSQDLFMDSASSARLFLQSTGKASYATLAALLDKGIFYLPLLFILRNFFGMYGIAFTAAVTLVFSLSAAIILTISWARKISPSFFPGFRAYLKIISAVCTPRLQELAEYSFIHAKKRGV